MLGSHTPRARHGKVQHLSLIQAKCAFIPPHKNNCQSTGRFPDTFRSEKTPRSGDGMTKEWVATFQCVKTP